jgi:hypothetical protein
MSSASIVMVMLLASSVGIKGENNSNTVSGSVNISANAT